MSSIAIRHSDKYKRLLFLNKEFYILFNKALKLDSTLPEHIQYSYQLKLSSLSKNIYAVRVQNRCILTGRSKSTYQRFKITRMVFKVLAGNGLIPGVRKSSW